MSSGTASGLVAALEGVWAEIRQWCPEVPEVVVVVAAGSEGKSLKLGHYAASRWHLAGAQRAEVLVGGEGLRRDGAGTADAGGVEQRRRCARKVDECAPPSRSTSRPYGRST